MKKSSIVLSAASVILIKTLLIYQKINGLVGQNRCRFYPSCSNYAIESLKKKGLIVALFSIIWRIIRCNPYNRGGFDPVR